jgi:signal peptidase I
MTSTEIISLIVTFIGVFSFAAIFTILYKSYATSQIAELRSGKKDIELIDEVIYERQTKVKRRRKVMKTIRTIVFYIIMIILVPLFIFSLVNRVQKNVTMIGNKTMMVVASGSMSMKNEANDYLITKNLNNQLNTYDIIFLEKVNNASDLKLYDIVAYTNDKGINVIHRIKEIRTDGSYVTRGDSNNEDDAYHPKFDDIIGKYTDFKLNGVGVFVMFLQSYAGIITVVSLVYCLIMIDRTAEKINLVQNKRIKQLEDVIDYSNESNIDSLKAEYVEKIYYKGFSYSFNENGFIEKTEIKDGEYLKKSDSAMIKEVTNTVTSEKIAEEIVLDEKEGE